MEVEFDGLISEVVNTLQSKKAELSKGFDSYLSDYEENLGRLKKESVKLKETDSWLKLQNSQNGERLVRITNVGYFRKGLLRAEPELYKKVEHKNICELRNLKQEIARHQLEFFTDEIEKMAVHYPSFASTKSSSEYLYELKQDLLKAVKVAVTDLEKLHSRQDHLRFSECVSEPQIFTALGESRVNCLTNMKGLNSSSQLSSVVHKTTHSGKINCVINVDDTNLASGGEDGEIHIINIKTEKETHKFVMKDVSAVTALGRIRASRNDIESRSIVERDANLDSEDKHDIFIISGHANPDSFLALWDLKEHKFIKQFKGHTDDITSICTLQDGHTIISGCKDGNVMVNDISQKGPLKIFGSLVSSPVTCLYLLNSLSHVAVGFLNGEINVCSIVYSQSSKYDRAVCSDLVI